MTKRRSESLYSTHPTSSPRITRGCYVFYLLEWMRYYDRENLFLITMDEFTNNSRKTLNDISKFLGIREIDSNFILDEGQKNDRHFVPDEHKIMLPETKEVLDAFYRPYNVLLSQLLHSDKWLFLE